MSTSNAEAWLPRVVIVGAGFGGLKAAKKLAGAPFAVTVIDRRNYHLFQPLLYQVATAALSPAEIAAPIRGILRGAENCTVLLAKVEGIDPTTQTIATDRGPVPYDYLILATGARHAYFGHDDWAEFAPGLKTIDDATSVRRRILLAFEHAENESDAAERARLLTFVVIGGGPTGVEMAGALAEISRRSLLRDFRHIDPSSARILLIEAGPSLIAAFPEKLREAARHDLMRLGVEVRTGAPVTRVGDGYVDIGSEQIQAETIIWAAGVAASPLGAALGVPLDRSGRVQIEPNLTIPGYPNVFVVGDLATLKDEHGNLLPGVAQVAIQMGKHASGNIIRSIEGQPLRAFHYNNLGNMATIGRAAAVADFGWFTLRGYIGWLAWLFVHIFNLIGFRNRLVVMVTWAWTYFTQQRGIRLITGVPVDPGVESARRDLPSR
jgi:NADH:ubiquinone reductase (H+-translocating)